MPGVDRSATVAEIVTTYSETASVFQRWGVDFCCRGGAPVPQVLAGSGKDPEALFAELDAAVAARTESARGTDPREMTTAALITAIVDTHHGYLRRVIPFLGPLVTKVARVHGEHDPKLAAVDAAFAELAGMLEPHLDIEEQVLFPALTSRTPDPEIVRIELARMHADHLAVGSKLAELRALTDGFTTPSWGCTSYRTAMAELEALEGDVFRHVHLETHVLMPRFTAQRAAA